METALTVICGPVHPGQAGRLCTRQPAPVKCICWPRRSTRTLRRRSRHPRRRAWAPTRGAGTVGGRRACAVKGLANNMNAFGELAAEHLPSASPWKSTIQRDTKGLETIDSASFVAETVDTTALGGTRLRQHRVCPLPSRLIQTALHPPSYTRRCRRAQTTDRTNPAGMIRVDDPCAAHHRRMSV